MTRRTLPCRAAGAVACCLMLAPGTGTDRGVPRQPAQARSPVRPQQSLRIDVDGVMAPVTARITLTCTGSSGARVTHLLAFGAGGEYDIIEQAPIEVSRTFRQTTEVRGLCRDDRGSTRRILPESVLVVDAALQRDSVVALSNAARNEAGVGRLSDDFKLDAVAQAHARDMAVRRYFDHISPEGMSLAQRLKEGGIEYVAAGENIGGNASAAGVVRAWQNSAGHRRNLLSSEFERIGVGVYRTPSSPYTYYVQVFAR